MAGRPSVMTPEVVAEICARIADGETVRQICKDDHMPAASNVYMAIARDAVFQEQYAKAREAQLNRWEDELLEISDDGTNDWIEREGKDGQIAYVVNGEAVARSRLRADTRKWIMSKRLPKKYGDRQAVEHTGADGAPLTVEVIRYGTKGQAE